MKLLRGRGVYDTRDGGLSLASFRSVSKISMPTATARSPRVETVVTGETRQYLEGGMQRMLRSRQDISEMKERLGIIPYTDRTLASNRRRYLQLVRALMKRDMVNQTEADEVRERVGVFLVEKTRERYTTADNRCEGQQLAFLAPTWSQLGDVRRSEPCRGRLGKRCSCFCSLPMGHTWRLFFCQRAIDEAMRATPSLDKAEILQDTRSCAALL